MKKKLFKNYTFTFDKNEKRILKTFCNQALNQMASDDRYVGEARAFNSIIEKLDSSAEEIKFTKDEKTRLVHNLKANVQGYEEQLKSAGFFKRWFIKSAMNQYKLLIENHFSD